MLRLQVRGRTVSRETNLLPLSKHTEIMAKKETTKRKRG